MARWTRFIPAVAVTLVLAACGQGTTDTPFSPSAPLHDGGNSLGSNYVPPPPDDGSVQTTSTTSSDPTGLPSDTTSRGGNSLGSN